MCRQTTRFSRVVFDFMNNHKKFLESAVIFPAIFTFLTNVLIWAIVFLCQDFNLHYFYVKNKAFNFTNKLNWSKMDITIKPIRKVGFI